MNSSPKSFLKVAAILTAATIGDGIFALPYVFYQSGWLLGLFYLVFLASIVIVVHTVYFETLQRVGEKERLLGLSKLYLGSAGFWTGFVAIVLGLLLTLVAYLILGTHFVQLGFPMLSPSLALAVFWIFMAVPVLWSDARVIEFELLGICLTAFLIILIFATAWPNVTFRGVPAINLKNFFLPFGAILFALAGWTGIEPAYESKKRADGDGIPWRAIALGTTFAAALYVMFISGILGSAPVITPDTISGLGTWSAGKRGLIAFLGLLAVWTVSMPLSREIKNALEKDLGWSKFSSRSIILFFPITLLLLGLNNFLVVVGLVGGLFLSLQYLLMVSVGRRALVLPAWKKFLLDVVAAIFILAAVYEVYYFVIG